MRTQPCNVAIMRGRLRKAEQFIESAGLVLDDRPDAVSDAYVTLCVHAGIAASDVICCVRLGEHAQGESHADAVALLRTADEDAAKHLSTLLGLKTKSGYSHMPVTAGELKRAGRAAEALAEAARRAHASGGGSAT